MRICQYISNNIITKDGVCFIEGHEHFSYNEGTIEDFILDAIQKSKDVSSQSRELASHIKDWPTRYHLSRERSLSYRSLNITKKEKVLEVGCGCGSVTRFLGEKAGYVLALEGSVRRSKITRSRTRDLDHVDVLCASFEDVIFTDKFDIVVCNGVLEYARLFIKHEEPFIKMLEYLSALVAPGGVLIIAIENKLGLRYFSSGKEEHTGVMYDGLEGYAAKPGGPETFGRKEIVDLIGRFFPSVEILLPLPDYKLPVAIIRSELTEKVNCAELFACTTSFKYGARVMPQMHERLVWHELHKNRCMEGFANSFFILAGDRKSRFLDPDWMGDIYAINRHPSLAVQTRILLGNGGKLETRKFYFESGLPKQDNESFAHQIGTSPWEDGISVHTMIARAFCNGKKISIEKRISNPVQIWWNAVQREGQNGNVLSGRALDYSWKNAIVNRDGVSIIDREWTFQGILEPSWLIYRTVTIFMNDELNYLHRWSRRCRWHSNYTIMMAVAEMVHEPLTFHLLIKSIKKEVEFKAFTDGGTVRNKKILERLVVLFVPISFRIWRKYFSRLLKRMAGK